MFWYKISKLKKTPGGKDFFKFLKKGDRFKFEINDHYTYGKSKKIKFKGEWFSKRHFDLRLEVPNPLRKMSLELYYFLYFRDLIGESEARKKVEKMKNLWPSRIFVSFAISNTEDFEKMIKFKKVNKVLLSRTANHPLDYSEGYKIGEYWRIEKGYGEGIQGVYDRGEYLVLDVSSERIVLWFEGKKIKGAYSLVYTSTPRKDDFLLVKMKTQNLKKLKEEYMKKKSFFWFIGQRSPEDVANIINDKRIRKEIPIYDFYPIEEIRRFVREIIGREDIVFEDEVIAILKNKGWEIR